MMDTQLTLWEVDTEGTEVPNPPTPAPDDDDGDDE
jgi:hypothetical protein